MPYAVRFPFDKIVANTMRPGDIFKLDDKYYEIRSYEHRNKGRGTASAKFQVIELMTQKQIPDMSFVVDKKLDSEQRAVHTRASHL